MRRKIAEAVITLSLMLTMSSVALYSNDTKESKTVEYDMYVFQAPRVADYAPSEVDTEVVEVAMSDEWEKDPLVPDIYYERTEDPEIAEEEFYDDLELLNLVTVAEAEGESEYGKRLVIDTVLNRVTSSKWPETISEVIFQDGQFECTWNGRMDRVEVSESVAELIMQELQARTNSDVIFFCSKGYNGPTHLFQEGNHYFSK